MFSQKRDFTNDKNGICNYLQILKSYIKLCKDFRGFKNVCWTEVFYCFLFVIIVYGTFVHIQKKTKEHIVFTDTDGTVYHCVVEGTSLRDGSKVPPEVRFSTIVWWWRWIKNNYYFIKSFSVVQTIIIHLVTDDSLNNRKTFYKVKIVFYSSSMNDDKFINYDDEVRQHSHWTPFKAIKARACQIWQKYAKTMTSDFVVASLCWFWTGFCLQTQWPNPCSKLIMKTSE